MMTISTTDRFSVHYAKRFRYKLGRFFIHKFDRVMLGFVLYLHGLFPIPFKPQKGTPTMITPPTCQVSVRQTFYDDYPVGMTNLRPFSHKKIDHKSINLTRIPTKIGTEMHFN